MKYHYVYVIFISPLLETEDVNTVREMFVILRIVNLDKPANGGQSIKSAAGLQREVHLPRVRYRAVSETVQAIIVGNKKKTTAAKLPPNRNSPACVKKKKTRYKNRRHTLAFGHFAT